MLAKKLAESVMQPTTLSRLQHIVSSAGTKVGRNTITDYIGYFYLPSQKMAVQASFSIHDNATFERETQALVKITKSFDIDKSVIVTYDDERTIDVDGVSIDVVPVWKWLLSMRG